MTVTVTVTDLTARQTKRLGEFLANLNIQRVQQGKAPFATIDAYAADYMQEWLTGNIRTFDIVDGDLVREAYIAANNAAQATVKTTLGLP
jgi:3-hydroxyacyl-CoA dehydrogenase